MQHLQGQHELAARSQIQGSGDNIGEEGMEMILHTEAGGRERLKMEGIKKAVFPEII